jgi:hypothetical protein
LEIANRYARKVEARLTHGPRFPLPILIGQGLFLHVFDRATNQTAEPILMVNSSNNVFSRRMKLFVGHVDPSPQLRTWLPNHLFGPILRTRGKSTDIEVQLDSWDRCS